MGCVDDLAGAFRIDHVALTIRLERRLDAGLLVERQGRRILIGSFHDVAASRQVADSGGRSLPFQVTNRVFRAIQAILEPGATSRYK